MWSNILADFSRKPRQIAARQTRLVEYQKGNSKWN